MIAHTRLEIIASSFEMPPFIICILGFTTGLDGSPSFGTAASAFLVGH